MSPNLKLDIQDRTHKSEQQNISVINGRMKKLHRIKLYYFKRHMQLVHNVFSESYFFNKISKDITIFLDRTISFIYYYIHFGIIYKKALTYVCQQTINLGNILTLIYQI